MAEDLEKLVRSEAVAGGLSPGQVAQLREYNDWSGQEPEDKVNNVRKTGAAGSRSVSTSSSRAKTFLCDHAGCDKAFSRPSLLTEHQQSVHLGMRPFECNRCDRAFARKNHLERHLLSHLDDAAKPFHCATCGKGVITQQQLKRHEITHTRSFKCPHDGCDEAFYKHPQLRSHIMAVHLHSLECTHCGKKFQRPYRLDNHIKKHHDPQVATPYSCTFPNCMQSFRTWTQLTLHSKRDHPKLKCPVCDKHLVGEAGLQMHMRIHDDTLVSRNWRCRLCTQPICSFPKKQDLVDHYTSVHPQEELPRELSADPHKLVQARDIATTAPDEPPRKKSKLDKLADNPLHAIESEANLHKYLTPVSVPASRPSSRSSSNSAMELLLNTVGRKLRCPFDKCYRTFKTRERYDTHVEKHKVHEEKLRQLEKEKEEEGN